MAPHTIAYLPLAAREFRVVYRWYARRSAAAAARFRLAVDQVERRIAAAPDQGALIHHRFRWMRVRRYPYVLYYEILDPIQVIVYAVGHTSRRPGYWLGRTRRP